MEYVIRLSNSALYREEGCEQPCSWQDADDAMNQTERWTKAKTMLRGMDHSNATVEEVMAHTDEFQNGARARAEWQQRLRDADADWWLSPMLISLLKG